MTALDGSPHGITETAAAHTENSHYQVIANNNGFVATYCLSILQGFADAQQPSWGETPQEYAQRHLALLQETGYIAPKAEVAA